MSTTSQSERTAQFFEIERDKLVDQITNVTSRIRPCTLNLTRWLQSFEELLLSTNVLNRNLEEVLGMTREYETIAALWKNFHELIKSKPDGS